MNFYDYLIETDRMSLIHSVEYKSPYISTEDRVLDDFEDIIRNNRKVLLYGDYDPDGMLFFLIVKRTFDHLGFSNYEIFRYGNRTHSIDNEAINKAIIGKFDYMIIGDAGSSEPHKIKRLKDYGIKTILIDHHQSVYDYNIFNMCSMVNSTFENRVNKEELIVSAGALAYIMCEKLIRRFGEKEPEDISVLALTSLYADIVDMTNPINRGIYYKATKVDSSRLPKMLQHFMRPGTPLTRRFIEYSFTPKINTLFRSENFKLLNEYIFHKPGNGYITEILERITEAHKKNREEVGKAADIIECKVMKNLVIGNLSSVMNYVDLDPSKIHNYTGLVANILARRYNKPAVVFADSGVNVKCSLRDLYGRNYLKIFKQFSNANGHNAAFGIHVDYMDFDRFLEYLKIVDEDHFIEEVSNEPLVIVHNYSTPDLKLLSDIALYNEFSGNTIPIALVKKVWLGGREYDNKYNYSYKWGDVYVKSASRVELGAEMLIKPYKGNGLQLSVEDSR